MNAQNFISGFAQTTIYLEENIIFHGNIQGNRL